MSSTDGLSPNALNDPSVANALSVRRSDSPADLMAGIDSAREDSRYKGRAALGVTGVETKNVKLGEVVRAGKGWYPITAIGGLTLVDAFQAQSFGVFGPDISQTLGMSRGSIAGLSALRLLAAFCSTLPIAALATKKPRRALLCKIAAVSWVFTCFAIGLARTGWVLAVFLIINGISNGTSQALHRPLVVDNYPPSGRVRMLALYRSADQVGNIATFFLIFALTTFLDLTWRGVLMVMGVLIIPFALYSLGLRDPGFGTFDEQTLRTELREQGEQGEPSQQGAQGEQTEQSVSEDLSTDDVALSFWETIRRLFLIRTVRKVLVGWAVLGMSYVPLSAYLNFFLADRWGLNAGARGLLTGLLPIFSLVALSATSRRSESMLRADPAKLLQRAAFGIAAGSVSLSLVPLVPSGYFVFMVLLLGAGFGFQGIGYPALEAAQLSIIPAAMRAHAQALAGVYLTAVGGLGGVLLFGSVDRRFGAGGVFVPVGVMGVVAGLVIRSGTKTIGTDLDRTVDAVVESEQLRALQSRGEKLPMLSCRGIDFSYGTVQVLFDVNFTVDDGEMVALLGTNGAGKSTLLRVVSGLGLPQSGTVRFRGQDITFVDAERRVQMGITQIPGGKAAFAPLTVVENLKVAGFTHGRNRQAVEQGIEASFAAFPRLAERRNQLAGTLSGGEQQMLALSKALILQPRLLVIDELSLGLAPKIVGELLEMVRVINAKGTAVVLVEQSVNVALSLVEHAYFMEKGEVRFDGNAAELLGRSDLLRSVFLEGSAKAMA
jgi:ABC-type branched-subunit amino acid transport system ATPase component/MFS family permease